MVASKKVAAYGLKPLTVVRQASERADRRAKIALKDGSAYEGILIGCDNHMNLLMDGVVECAHGVETARLTRALIVGRNILYIQFLQTRSR